MKKFTLTTLIIVSIFSAIFSSALTWKYAKKSICPSVPCTVEWSDGEIHEYQQEENKMRRKTLTIKKECFEKMRNEDFTTEELEKIQKAFKEKW